MLNQFSTGSDWCQRKEGDNFRYSTITCSEYLGQLCDLHITQSLPPNIPPLEEGTRQLFPTLGIFNSSCFIQAFSTHRTMSIAFTESTKTSSSCTAHLEFSPRLKLFELLSLCTLQLLISLIWDCRGEQWLIQEVISSWVSYQRPSSNLHRLHHTQLRFPPLSHKVYGSPPLSTEIKAAKSHPDRSHCKYCPPSSPLALPIPCPGVKCMGCDWRQTPAENKSVVAVTNDVLALIRGRVCGSLVDGS